MTETVFTNARIVLADAVIDRGAIVVEHGLIRAIDTTPSRLAGAVDFEGDLLIPGLVELHTDNLEGHIAPRPGAQWPAVSAVIAHDSQIAACGITTVFDAVAIGDVQSESTRIALLDDMLHGIETAQDAGLLKAEHFVHLRCEVSHAGMADLLDALIDRKTVRLLSVMDHTPGQRQFTSLEVYANYYMNKHGLTADGIRDFIEKKKAEQEAHSTPNRRHVVAAGRARGISIASHDDATAEHVAEAVADGVTIAEFPTTVEAARASHEAGIAVMMGGPNLVRGGSHSGNVSALDLARRGHLDIISSDYAPVSLLHGAMMLADQVEGIDLPAAVAMVSRTPARAAGLDDRGEIAEGRRADLLRVHPSPHHPVIRGVWRASRRIG